MNGDGRARFGTAVKSIRTASKLTQQAVAEKSGLHLTYIAGIESGRRNPTYLVILRLADGLGVAPHELVRKAEDV